MEPAEKTADVVIVGAGFSGLVAARSLARLGRSVVVLEARDQVGGRSRRVPALQGSREEFWVDEGGQWVGPTQSLFLELLDSYQLERYDSFGGMGAVSLSWSGTRTLLPPFNEVGDVEGLLEVAAAAPNDVRQGLQEMMAVQAEVAELATTVDPAAPWVSPTSRALDGTTWLEFVNSRTRSPLARFMLCTLGMDNGALSAEAAWTSVLHVARSAAAAPTSEAPEKWLVKGGVGQVPALLAEDVKSAGGEVLLSSPVVSITQSAGRAVVQAAAATVHARHVIVAMPPHLCGRIRYEPPMPALRDQLTQRMPMGPVIKCVAVYSEPFWRDQAGAGQPQVGMFIGPCVEGGAVRVAVDMSPPPAAAGTRSVGVLGAFIGYDAVDAFDLTADERKRRVLRSFQEWCGPRALQPLEFVQKVWAAEPYTGGGYTSVMPAGGWRYGRALTQPVGCIHWAGSEVSARWPGYYEGAIQAGQDAAAEVEAALAEEKSPAAE